MEQGTLRRTQDVVAVAAMRCGEGRRFGVGRYVPLERAIPDGQDFRRQQGRGGSSRGGRSGSGREGGQLDWEVRKQSQLACECLERLLGRRRGQGYGDQEEREMSGKLGGFWGACKPH